MTTALEMLREQDFDVISVRELVDRAGCSVGSFYHRFATKEGLFDALIELMLARRGEAIDIMFENTPTAKLAEAIVRGALANYRAHANLLRSGIRYHLQGRDSWRPISRFGREVTQRYIQRIELEGERKLSPDEIKRIEFVFIWLHGHLTNSIAYTYHLYDFSDDFFEEQTVNNFVLSINKAVRS
ncbi:MAG TPA: TetR/AcrR family transcriptional regulator [Sphingomonadaceae bacterium]|nr:TetR/AcrR family transcriptional regulator [Sphingomonadaceae bacterium]